MLIADSGPHATDRYIILGSRATVEFLGTCLEWNVDGTFKTCPRLFKQVCFISNAVVLAYIINQTACHFDKES